jgi:hypothetical protein
MSMFMGTKKQLNNYHACLGTGEEHGEEGAFSRYI